MPRSVLRRALQLDRGQLNVWAWKPKAFHHDLDLIRRLEVVGRLVLTVLKALTHISEQPSPSLGQTL
jgi:hypothetical protein